MVRDTKSANKSYGEKSQVKESHHRRDTICLVKLENGLLYFMWK